MKRIVILLVAGAAVAGMAASLAPASGSTEEAFLATRLSKLAILSSIVTHLDRTETLHLYQTLLAPTRSLRRKSFAGSSPA